MARWITTYDAARQGIELCGTARAAQEGGQAQDTSAYENQV